jgi:hypothetical protein
MAKPKTYNELRDAEGKSVSLADTFNQMGEISVGVGTIGTGRGILAGSGTTISDRGTVTRGAGGSSGTGGSSETGGSSGTGNNNNVDLSGSFGQLPNKTPEFAMSPYGDLELTKYLYESGLQNIFSDYQKNIQTLQQSEAQQLQQAYAIREMSKKYLGEYASNVGVGDVSGNLLDIYSQYASNIGDIQQNFAALEMNLTREYTMERMNTFNELLKTQYKIDVAELDEAAFDASNYVFENFGTDVAGGLAYLESQKDNMRPQDFDAVKQSYYQSNLQSVVDNVTSANPYYGFSDLETQTLKTQEQYLEEAKKWLRPEDLTRVREILALKELYGTEGGDIEFSPVLGLDASVFSSNSDITSESDIYEVTITENGQERLNRLAVSSVPILYDEAASGNGITPDLLNEIFEKDNPGISRADIPENKIVNYQGFYIFRDNNWYRMQDIGGSGAAFDKFTVNQLSTWTAGYEGTRLGGIEINFNFDDKGRDAVTYQGKTYVEDTDIGEYKNLLGSADFDMQGLISFLNNKFLTKATGKKPSSTEVEGYVPKGQVFFYNGQFFVYTEDGAKIRPMKLQTETE